MGRELYDAVILCLSVNKRQRRICFIPTAMHLSATISTCRLQCTEGSDLIHYSLRGISLHAPVAGPAIAIADNSSAGLNLAKPTLSPLAIFPSSHRTIGHGCNSSSCISLNALCRR